MESYRFKKRGRGGPFLHLSALYPILCLRASVANQSPILRTHFQVPYPLTPLFATLTKTPGVWGVFFPFWDLSPALARYHATSFRSCDYKMQISQPLFLMFMQIARGVRMPIPKSPMIITFLDHLAKSRSSSAPLISLTVTDDDSLYTHLLARDKITSRVNQESPSVRRAILAFVLVFLTAGLSASAQSTDPASATPTQQTSPTPAPCAANCPQTPAKPATATPNSPAKPPAKPHKVLTNDDIDAQPHYISIAGGRDILQQLNTCDRTCFDQVAQRAGTNSAYSAKGKLALLDAVETVKRDMAWQETLGEILGIQDQACETQVRKTEDLRKYADSRNITPSELAVERQYEPKFREIHNRLNAALDRANAHIAKNAPGNLQAQYMHMQVDKLVHATCTINVPAPLEDTDDPVDP